MEGFPNKKLNEDKEKTSYLEKIGKVARPLVLYGMCTLSLLKGLNEKNNTDYLSAEDEISTIEKTENEDTNTIFDAANVTIGKNGFNYYNPEILKDFQTFFEYAKKDDGFKKSRVYIETKYLYSKERLELLKKELNIPGIDEDHKKYIEKEINNFSFVNDEEKLFNIAMKMKYENILSHIQDINKQKEWIIKIIESDEFLNRLTSEFNGDLNKAKDNQEKRLNRFNDFNYFISNNDSLSSAGNKKTIGMAIFSTKKNEKSKGKILIHNESIKGVQNIKDTDGKIYTKNTQNLFMLHEMSHYSSMYLIPEFTKEVFEKYIDTTDMHKYQIDKWEYYTSPDEIIARKTVLDSELERLNIKKYKDEFTEEHYLKIKELIKKGELDINAEQFFRSFRKDGIMYIMNNVALILGREESNKNEAMV